MTGGGESPSVAAEGGRKLSPPRSMGPAPANTHLRSLGYRHPSPPAAVGDAAGAVGLGRDPLGGDQAHASQVWAPAAGRVAALITHRVPSKHRQTANAPPLGARAS